MCNLHFKSNLPNADVTQAQCTAINTHRSYSEMVVVMDWAVDNYEQL